MNHSTDISWPMAKILSVWAAFGVSSWQEAAAFAAFVYSLCLIGEFMYKKIWINLRKDKIK